MGKIGRPKRNIPDNSAYGAIILSIAMGNKKVSSLSKDLNKKHPTIIEQLGYLEKDSWIKRNKKTKDYRINYKKLISYYVEKFKMDKKILEENLPTWLKQIAVSTKEISLNGIGTQLIIILTIYEIAVGNMSVFESIKHAAKRIGMPGFAKMVRKSGYKKREVK